MAERSLKALCNGLIPEGFSLPEGRLLLAFSGGEDSLFLMSLLSLIAPRRSAALYVNHGIRSGAELEREEAINAHNASLLGIPLVIKRIPEGDVEKLARTGNIGIEAAARELRYGILRSYARDNGFDRILTAHHMDDQAETVIMRLLSSAPFYALGGIRRDDGMICRPLLDVPKETIRKGVLRLGLEVSEDSTNSDTGYLRNSIRHRIMPMISPECRILLSRIADNVAELRKKAVILDGGDGFFLEYNRKEFLSLDRLSQELTIFAAAEKLGLHGRFSRKLAAEIIDRIEIGSGRLLLPSISVFPNGELFRIYPDLDRFVSGWDWNEMCIGRLCLRSEHVDSRTLIIDPEVVRPPVIFRSSEEGDRIHLRTGWKKVSELEKEWRVPYSAVLEDRIGVIAVFGAVFGGRDRLSSRFMDHPGVPVTLALGRE